MTDQFESKPNLPVAISTLKNLAQVIVWALLLYRFFALILIILPSTILSGNLIRPDLFRGSLKPIKQ